jgi:hypothetical protein
MKPTGSVPAESYLEKCVAALPADKRAAARAAFAEIADTGEDCYLSKLLAVLEANNAYARTIPRELAAVHEQFLSDLARDTSRIRQELREAESSRDAVLRKLLHQEVHALDKTLPLTRAVEELHTNSLNLGRLKESVAGQSVQLTVLCAVLVVGLVVAGAIFFMSRSSGARTEPEEVRTAREFLDTLSAARIRLKIQKTATGEMLTVKGPTAKPEVGWHRDASGNIAGLEIVYAAPSPR